MNKRLILWLVPALVYIVFSLWYTGLGGKLKADEIEAFVKMFEERGVPQDRIANLRRYMEEDTGKQIFILNALDLAEDPVLPEGAEPGASASDLMAHYMEYMYPALFKRASHPVFFGTAVSDAVDLVGIEGAEHWENGAIFRYRSRRDALEISSDPRFATRHDYKLAALEKTIAYPMEANIYLSDPRFLLLLILALLTALIDIAIYGRRRQG